MKKIVVLVSGNGSNLQAIIDATKNNTLPDCVISEVISNKAEAGGLQRAGGAGILSTPLVLQSGETRERYDTRLAQHILSVTPNVDLIVLAGWMRILTKNFINAFLPGTIINLHPALPGQFPGSDGIGDALRAYKQGKIVRTGLMIHEVTEVLDEGRVLETESVDIMPYDTLETLTRRVQSREKLALINAIYKKLFQNTSPKSHVGSVYKGKVRQMHYLGYNVVAMEHSDRLSAFDRHICNVPGKGQLLLETSKWWFDRTKWIVPNHYISHNSNVMFVKQCTPIPLEVIVRGYITGSTKTSLWTHYNAGERSYCGHILPDGLLKNSKLPGNTQHSFEDLRSRAKGVDGLRRGSIVTPTTKGEVDELIDTKTILERGIVDADTWNYIQKVALQLFEFGQDTAARRGLILVDTKYEFGYDCNGTITLIDEIHTQDSSRYWIAGTYDDIMKANTCLIDPIEPDKLDKDYIRDYLKLQLKWDPYAEGSVVPNVSSELIDNTYNAYLSLYLSLTGQSASEWQNNQYKSFDVVVQNYWNCIHSPKIMIISEDDTNYSQKFISKLLDESIENGVYAECVVKSAYMKPEAVSSYIKEQDRSKKVILISVGSIQFGAHLSTKSIHPTIICPLLMNSLNNIHSLFEVPQNTAGTIVLDASNAILAAKKILR